MEEMPLFVGLSTSGKMPMYDKHLILLQFSGFVNPGTDRFTSVSTAELFSVPQGFAR
jgi:hypothetical protein